MTFADTVSGMSYKMVLESAIMAAKKKKNKQNKNLRKASPILNPHSPRQLVHTYAQQEKKLGQKWVDSRTLDLRLRIPPQAQGHPSYTCGPEKISASWNRQLSLTLL